MVAALLAWLALETGATRENFDAVSNLAVHLLGFEKATSWAKLGQALASIRSDAPEVLDEITRKEPEVISLFEQPVLQKIPTPNLVLPR
jgi:hypothetical protein